MSGGETTPGVFIIESTNALDEEENRQEGKALQEILRLTNRYVMYRYIRTEKELKAMFGQFQDSRFRYLHLACHGNRKKIALTLDRITLADLANMLSPFMHGRRLFISSCEGAQSSLAVPILRSSDCYSVVGPSNEIPFRDAVVAWVAFYTLMSQRNPAKMKRAVIQPVMRGVCDLFNVSFNGFFRDGNKIRVEKFRPHPITQEDR
jgi:hypothetical protein